VNALVIDRCVLCGYPVRKPGELLCVRHDIQALIAEGYYRMKERMKYGAPPRRKYNQTRSMK
jgi:hypothetical protein